MNQQLARGDFQVRQTDYDIALVTYEQRGAKGRKPTPPRKTNGVGISRVYCNLLSLVGVAKLAAQAPPAATRIDSTPSLAARPPIPVTPRRDSLGRPTGESAMVHEMRLQEARFRRAEALRERNRYDVEIQKKFSLAAACTIFVLVGAPIALRFPRGGVGLVIGVSFAIFGLYYVGLIGGETLADKGLLPPWVAMWAANIILLLLGLGLASQMGRESATSRGGDFREFLTAARVRMLGWLRPLGIPVERRRA
jgi:hypothetical protein